MEIKFEIFSKIRNIMLPIVGVKVNVNVRAKKPSNERLSQPNYLLTKGNARENK